MLPELSVDDLVHEAAQFAEQSSRQTDAALFGVTDGKAIGTYLEHRFTTYLERSYLFRAGNSAAGIDFPGIAVDMKVTSVNRPQSSCPFRSARQKIFGLGYGLLVFVYDKEDDHSQRTGRLDIQHCIYVDAARTGDYQTTRGILEILARDGNVDDLLAFIQDRNLPVNEIEAYAIAEELLNRPPLQGYLTISNALQWRLQFGRAIAQAGLTPEIRRIR